MGSRRCRRSQQRLKCRRTIRENPFLKPPAVETNRYVGEIALDSEGKVDHPRKRLLDLGSSPEITREKVVVVNEHRARRRVDDRFASRGVPERRRRWLMSRGVRRTDLTMIFASDDQCVVTGRLRHNILNEAPKHRHRGGLRSPTSTPKPLRSPCGPFRHLLRSLCGPNPREHPRTPANTASATPSVFATFRCYSRIFAVLEENRRVRR